MIRYKFKQKNLLSDINDNILSANDKEPTIGQFIINNEQNHNTTKWQYCSITHTE